MVLYDENKVAQFYNSEEVRDILMDYIEFNARRNAFDRNPEGVGDMLLSGIEKIRRIPKNLRYSLPDYFRIREKDLDDLEEKCKNIMKSDLSNK